MRWGLLVFLFGLMMVAMRGERCTPSPAQIPKKADWPEWDVVQRTDPLTEALLATGEELHWGKVKPQGSTRLFLSNHPEAILYTTPEGMLWAEEGTVGADAVAYRLFFQHYNHVPGKIFLGVVIENLSPAGSLTLSGECAITRGVDYGLPHEAWGAMKNVGKRTAYAELSGKLRTPLEPVTVQGKDGRRAVITWMMNPGDMLGGRMWLTVKRASGTKPVNFRLSTVWAKREDKLTKPLPLIPAGKHHPRGSWPVSEVSLTNNTEPFDVGTVEKDGRTVRWIRICQPVYENGVKVRYTDDVIFLKDKSLNPQQALANNGMYGAVINTHLVVKNSGTTDARVGLYLRYPVKDLEGVYVGAATTYDYHEATDKWTPAQTRAVDLSNLTYFDDEDDVGDLPRHHRWWTTACMASYPVKAGQTRTIPLTLTNDGPAMLPLAIVLRREVGE